VKSDQQLTEFSRREALVRAAVGAAGLSAVAAMVTGCGSSGQKAAALPGVDWPDSGLARPAPKPMPGKPGVPNIQLPGGVIPRSEWARGGVIPARMQRARPYYRITIHHDGMDTFASTDKAAAAQRLEQIRNAHLNRPGEPFGDIGYHYVIDPAGRIWQGRPLEWQGAHVAKTNEGNLGICCLGNFMQQRPTQAQLVALDRFVVSQMERYRVSPGNVFTHRELGQTVCPGDNLQPYIADSRRKGPIAHA
jgi:hypothetical protein